MLDLFFHEWLQGLAPGAVLLLFLAGLCSGFIDSIAGGGGMISLPALLAVGLPPHAALATNKLQSSFGSGMAAWHYSRNGLIEFRSLRRTVLYTGLGAAAGVLAVQWIPEGILIHIVPPALFVVLLYFVFQPDAGSIDRHPRVAARPFARSAGASLGFYDGFLGPGTGSFWTMAQVFFLGTNLKKATAQTKVMNFTSNVVSLAVFALAGQVVLICGLFMALGQITGARLGSHLVIRHHPRLVRHFLVAVVSVTLAKIIWELYA